MEAYELIDRCVVFLACSTLDFIANCVKNTRHNGAFILALDAELPADGVGIFFGSGMWDKLIDLLLGNAIERLKERNSPRKRMTKAFGALFTAIKTCHTEYAKWQTEVENLSLEEQWLYNTEKWQRSINELAERIDKLRILLQIHEPDLLDALDDYRIAEEISSRWWFTERVKMLTPITAQIAEAIVHKGRNELSEDSYSNFEAVMTKLRLFMRDQLKLTPEELLDL